MEEIICPKCKQLFKGFPALSRRDNKTKICSACGLNEAMEDFVLAEARKSPAVLCQVNKNIKEFCFCYISRRQKTTT